jgi:hypothetical protein
MAVLYQVPDEAFDDPQIRHLTRVGDARMPVRAPAIAPAGHHIRLYHHPVRLRYAVLQSPGGIIQIQSAPYHGIYLLITQIRIQRRRQIAQLFISG